MTEDDDREAPVDEADDRAVPPDEGEATMPEPTGRDHVGDDELLETLDETPSTVTALARRLDAQPAAIEAGLERVEVDGLAMCWGEVWATTWRAKLSLAPGFFRFWGPMSLAVGAAVAALAISLHGPAGDPAWPVPVLGGLAVVAGLVAVFWPDDER